MERFRTVKLSDPRFEEGHLRYLTIKTSNLNGRGNISVFIPPNTGRTDLPVTMLLHGVYGSCHSWSHAAGAHITTLQLIKEKKIAPMILAMPSDGLWGDGSGYLPHSNYDFEKWICKDVLDAVRIYIPEATNSTDTFLAGLSMGGFGALRLGAKYGSIFKAFSGLSSITSLAQMHLFVEENITSYAQDNPMDEDVYTTILANRKNLSPFRFDCGKDDKLIEFNRMLHDQLIEVNINHIYEENEGVHEWAYWEKHLPDTLLFFNQFL